MKKNICFLILFCVVIMFPALSKAQYIANYKQQGDTYFNNKNYYAAAFYYQKALKLLPDSTGKTYYLPYNVVDPGKNKKLEQNAEKYQYLVYQLGQAFRLYKDFKSAGKWYAESLKFKNNKFPLSRLWYGVCLRADQRYRDAIKTLKTFQSAYAPDDRYSKKAELEIRSCQYAIRESRYPRLMSVTQLSGPVNADKGSNYAAVKVQDTLYFTSSRPYKKIDAKKHNPFINKIYRSRILSPREYGQPEALDISGKALTEEAAPSLSAAGTYIYLTEWQQADRKRKKAAHYIIAVSQRDAGGKWTTAKRLGPPVNIPGSDAKEASVAMDGRYLIFSSNRPGGSGGYDLWYCRLDEQGLPVGEAVNLGYQINSGGDEVNPYYDQKEGKLVYSSNGLVGLGGFDLFQSKGNFGADTWTQPKNMGYPINSSKDDIFYYPLDGKEDFYLSSDRNSPCCLALYQIHLKKLRITGKVFDQKTGKVISTAKVILKDSISNKVIGSILTTVQGRYSFNLMNRRPLKLHFFKENYIPRDIMVSTENLRKVDTIYHQDTYLIAYEMNKPIIIRNIYYDFDKALLRPDSKSALDTLINLLKNNPNWIVEIGSHTDSIGSSSYNQWLSQQRAQSVVDYLIMKGIPKDHLKAKGYGKNHPIVPNSRPDGTDNPEGRQLNRRTEFMIIGIKNENGSSIENEIYKSIIGDKSKIKIDRSLKPWLSRQR